MVLVMMVLIVMIVIGGDGVSDDGASVLRDEF